MKNKYIIYEINKIQEFIEEDGSKDSLGNILSYFEKLCFVQEDLTQLKKRIIKSNQERSDDE